MCGYRQSKKQGEFEFVDVGPGLIFVSSDLNDNKEVRVMNSNAVKYGSPFTFV